MFASIVVGFDGSTHAAKGLEIGATLAARDRSRLGIIYVIDPGHLTIPEELREMGRVEHVIDPMPKMPVRLDNAPQPMIESMAQASVDSERALYQFADFLVEQAAASARECGASEIETRTGIGNPAEQIVEFARERDADLIVVGCRGFGKLKRLLLGSTSQQVGQLAACSCLTVK